MPEYNFLPHNESDFPLINNVDTYKYDNSFDYRRFDAIQMELQICTVPWDMGEAHIGNRTISGIGNVVYFGSKRERDEWFDAIPDDECYRFTTKFKELHSSLQIDVPIPYDVCAKHNYLVVRYALFANDDSPVIYEDETGLREWFWFIREVEFLAPNTTRLHILDDAFQTWIYDVNISGMVLERGHAPMFATRADEFLDNPIENNEYLLTEDVNYGEASNVKHIDALPLNDGTMYACIATTANPAGSWGTKAADTWTVPASSYYNNDGCPSVYVFAMQAANLNTFLTNVDSSCPQFKQTIQGVFFASKTLVTLAGSFTFCSITCYGVAAGRKKLNLSNWTKEQFGYAEKYRDIAKLYTDPYAHIEVTDENGNVDIIKVEDTTGKLQVSAALSLAYPFINIDAHLLGVGGVADKTITFRNITSHTFDIAGQWYDYLRSWSIPTFAVIQQASTEYDYSTHFDRAQRVVDYTTEYDNETARVATAKANVDANADTLIDNADATQATNTSITNRANLSSLNDSIYTQTFNSDMVSADNAIIYNTADSTVASNEQQGAISSSASISKGVAGAVGDLMSMNWGGAISTATCGFIDGAATQASTVVTNGLTITQSGYTAYNNVAHATISNTKTADESSNHISAASDITTMQNLLLDTTTANTAATLKANAARDYATGNANAARTQSQAQSAIANDISQAALQDPYQYGTFANGQSAATKPIALFANVVTQSKSAIASAGDEFLRYGYMLDRQWPFDGNWNVGKYFTYWKLKDFWVQNLNVPDMYMDKLRFFLFGGVTIWRNPDDIGKITVYDNFKS